MVFVHQGTADEGDDFFRRFWPQAIAVADPQHRLYDTFDIPRGGVGQVLGPRTFACAIRAALRGNGFGKPIGDVWRMPGALLMHRGQILWSHTFRHIGDEPDYATIPALLRAAFEEVAHEGAGRAPSIS